MIKRHPNLAIWVPASIRGKYMAFNHFNNTSSSSKCPFSGGGNEIQLFEQDYWDNPYPIWEKVRPNEPIFYNPEVNYWIVSRYEDIKAILSNPRDFSAQVIREPIQKLSDQALQVLKDGGFDPYTIAGNDPPGHTKIRKAINYAFTPKRVNQIESEIRALVNEYIDGFISKDEVDLVEEMFYQLPADVLFIFLGFPKQQVRRIKELATHRLLLQFGKLPEEEQEREAHGLVEFWHFCKEMVREVAEAKETPDNFMGDLIRYRNGDEDKLSLHEIASIVYSLLFAGHETTTGLAGNAVQTLLTDRDVWEEICANPELIPNAVEEVLRYNTSVFYWRRRTVKTVNFAGVEIPEGANLLLVLGAAGRDERKYNEPERFNIRRENVKDHLGFGFGIHFCVGAPLARLDMSVILTELCKRLPNMRLVEKPIVPITPNLFARSPKELWVKW
jgi:cytochrome P450